MDTESGAAVRIAMTAGAFGIAAGFAVEVVSERAGQDGEIDVTIRSVSGRIDSALGPGGDVGSAARLRSNVGLSFMGVTLVGDGFRLAGPELQQLGLQPNELPPVVRPYVAGRELAQAAQARYVVDLFGYSDADARREWPSLYQRLSDRVRPERAQNKRAAYRDRWWIFGEPRQAMRRALAGLQRFIATLETSKHRFFLFQPAEVMADHTVFVIASDDADVLGVLSSRVHVAWAIAAGATLEDRPRWRNVTCFEPFPFPACSDDLKSRIRTLGEFLDAHRKRQQALHPDLTITGMYNVLTKLRSGEALTAKEKIIHEQGLVSVLKQIHDDLDAAVFDAYGWPHDLTDEQILERLVALNRERAEEEKNGVIRWLRPEFQAPKGAAPATQPALAGTGDAGEVEAAPAAVEVAWPKKLPAQIAAVRELFRGISRALLLDDVTRAFKGAKKKNVEAVLDSLTALGLLTVFDSEGSRRWRAELRTAA